MLFSNFQLILPVFNESSRIVKILQHYYAYCRDIMIIDNLSTDNTVNLIMNNFPRVRIVSIPNHGTTETPQWWLDAAPYFSQEFVLFGSCSEFISQDLLNIYNLIAELGNVDICFTTRCTITGGYCTDPLYCKASSFLSPRIILPQVARLVRWRSIKPHLIKPHDTFRSQVHCRVLTLSASSRELCILHIRPMPPFQLVNPKLKMYARQQALYSNYKNPFQCTVDIILRGSLDVLRLFRSFVYFQYNKAIGIEFLQRLPMHLMVILYCYSFTITHYSRKLNIRIQS